MPSLFKSSEAFKEWFHRPLSDKNKNDEIKEENNYINKTTSTKPERMVIMRLKGLIKPFMLRRLKDDCNLGLPPKTEKIIWCKFSKRQRQLYEDFLSRGRTKKDLKEGSYLKVMSVFIKLRKVCNHPDLFEGKEVKTPLNFYFLDDFEEFFGINNNKELKKSIIVPKVD